MSGQYTVVRVKAAIPYRLAECPEAEGVKPPMRHPRDVKNKVLGLVGFGKIETTVARMCSQAFGMRVKLYDPHFPNEKKKNWLGRYAVPVLSSFSAPLT